MSGSVVSPPFPTFTPPESPLDNDSFGVDFGPILLEDGSSIVGSPVVTLVSGSIVLGATGLFGTVVSFFASGGVAGTLSNVRITIVTTTGRTINRTVVVPTQIR